MQNHVKRLYRNKLKSTHHGPNVAKRWARGLAGQLSLDSLSVLCSSADESTDNEQVVREEPGRVL